VYSQRKDLAYDLWLVRSQTLTAELIKDGDNLETSQRSILLAKLAQQWWRDNPEKAKAWMSEAIASVESVPNKENPDDRRKRLNTARQLLQIAVRLDHKFSERLVDLLKEQNKQLGADDRSANAEGLIDAALSLVDADPVRAAELGAISLSVGPPTTLFSLILALRLKNPKLGDALLAQALDVGRGTLDAELLHSITRATFPSEMQIVTKAPAAAEALRNAVLQVDIAYLQANPVTPNSENPVCAIIGSLILPVLKEFDRRFPQQAPAARQAVNQCQSRSPLIQQLVDDATRTEPLDTVEELLKAAEDSQDLKVRTVYEYRAASLAKEKKQCDRAITILDGINEDGRKFMGSTWQNIRWDWASLCAIEHYSKGDLQAMRVTIQAVPDDLKAFTKLAFVDRLPKERTNDSDPTLEFLRDAHKELPKSYGSEIDRYPWYFALLRLTVQYTPEDTGASLKEAFAALNRAEQGDEKSNQDTSGIWKNLPLVSLINMDEYAVKEAVSSISSAQKRVELRLELLQVCVDRMRSRR
jgi:hypothetical protein